MRITNEMNTQTISVVDLFGEFNAAWDYYAVQQALAVVEWSKVVACEFALTTEITEADLRSLFFANTSVGDQYRIERMLVVEGLAAGKTESEIFEKLERIQQQVQRLQTRALYN